MSEELLRRMEQAVRRFGGPAAIDDLLPELDAACAAPESDMPGETGDRDRSPDRPGAGEVPAR